jgi:predicted hotdog family 3-hydroxylacyl-ACP dehydratase
MSIPAKNIHSFIPQRPPFVMVDELIYSDDTSARTRFLVRSDNLFLEEGCLKEPALVENIAQTAAAHAGYQAIRENKPVQTGYIGAVKNLEIFFLPKTGEELITEITIENQIFNATVITGTVLCNQKTAARCQMKIFINQS